MKKLRVAVVGFGFMGKTHAKNIIEGDLMELSAIVDPQSDTINQKAGNIDTGEISDEILSKISKYNHIDACLRKETLDAVFICVHTLLHYEIAMKSLQHGLHVFIEKPFILDVEGGERLLNEAKKRNLVLAVGHVVRFMPAYVKLYEMYKNEVHGKLKFISVSRFSGLPVWGEWGKRREDFGSSGGALFDLVIHDVDFLHHLLGMPKKVDAVCIPGALSNHDYLSADWYYPDETVRVKVEGGFIFHNRFPFGAGFMALFEKASVSWSSATGNELNVADNETLQVIPLGDANEGYVLEIDRFAQGVLSGGGGLCSAESALDTIRLCYKHIEK